MLDRLAVNLDAAHTPGMQQLDQFFFSMFSDFSKLVLIFDMLAGRLELFPLLLLFVPNTWRRF